MIIRAQAVLQSGGVVTTIFLDDVTPVPSSAVFLEGVAYAHDGSLYVCNYPASDPVTILQKVAVRNDGAIVINTSGTIAGYDSGFALTTQGELLVSTSAPQVYKSGLGARSDGSLCVSEVS